MSFIRAYGKSPAAEGLALMLEELNDPKTKRKVSKMLANFNHILSELEKVDTRVAPGIAKLMMEAYVAGLGSLDGSIKSYAENVLKTKYRVWVAKTKALMPYKNRKKLFEDEG